VLAISLCPTGFLGWNLFGSQPGNRSFNSSWHAFTFYGRFNPMFIIPIPEHDAPPMAPRSPAVIDSGRHVRAATRHMPQSSQQNGTSIIGFRESPLLSLITLTGHIPSHGKTHASLEELRKKVDRPIIVFPECTTSNGRSLLRFANLFHQNTPVRDYRVFLICARSILFHTCHWSPSLHMR
jgi:hypothetical protein